ncbi:unnamed protein product [Mucor hiemalis]
MQRPWLRMNGDKVALTTFVFILMIIQRFLHLLASFFLFVAFILELLVILGQLSNKAFLNILYFVQANNGQYNLSYNFGLWSYCHGQYNAPVQECSHPVAAYNWAKTPGFSQMLPSYSKSKKLENIFLALFILYFIGMIFSFLLWVTTLPFALFCCCSRSVKHTGRKFDLLMAVFTTVTFFVMFTALVLALVLVVGTVKAVSGGSVYWGGQAGISLWFTIASVVSLFMAAFCYYLKSCCSSSGDSNYGSRVDPVTENRYAHKHGAFDLTPHQSNAYTPRIMKGEVATSQNHHYRPHNTYQPQLQPQEPYSISSLSQQYSPALQPQYLSPIYTDNNQNGANLAPYNANTARP